MTTTADQMTSATYLPAGCKRVKLNLANAYRTTYTHLVVGDRVRVRNVNGKLEPSSTQATKDSVWAEVTSVTRNGQSVTVRVYAAAFNLDRQLPWEAAHTAITRKERAAEYSARLMLAEQEREASLKASAAELERKRAVASLPLEEPAALAAGLVEISTEAGEADPIAHAMRAIARLTEASTPEVRDYYRLVYAELMNLADRARRMQCGVEGHAHTTILAAADCKVQRQVAHVKAGGTWDDDLARDAAVRQSGIQQQWAAARQPVSVHEPKLDAAGLCVLVMDRPSGIPTQCGEPVKSPIHDPAAYTAYATELALELKKWQDPTGTEVDRALEIAFPSVPAQRQPLGGGQPRLQTDMRDRALKAEAKLEQMRSTMTSLRDEARSRAANWVPEHNLTSLELESKADLLDVLLRLLES